MNKTVTINLANSVFHIDEDAFHILQQYLNAIKRAFTNTAGSDEIIADIEARIAELFNARTVTERQVITTKNVEEIIAIMGQPEDYMVDEDIFEDEPKGASKTKGKKLYRDIDNKRIGGVAIGLAHYLGTEALVIRLIFILLIFVNGFGALTYLLLWVLIPKATTTAQKLDMSGKPVNINSIEKKVTENINKVADKVKNADYDKMGSSVKSGTKSVLDSLGEAITFVFSVIGKFIGVMLLIAGFASLIGLFIGMSTVGIMDIVHVPGIDFYEIVNSTNAPAWLVSLLGFITLGIPAFFIGYTGLRMVASTLKRLHSSAIISLVVVWILAVVTISVLGIKQMASHAFSGSVSEKEMLVTSQPIDTLTINMSSSELYELDTNHRYFEGMSLIRKQNGDPILLSKNMRYDIKAVQDSTLSIRVRKDADGSSYDEARTRAKNIQYSYDFGNSTLTLADYFSTTKDQKVRNQRVYNTLYIPIGTAIKFASNAGNYLEWRLHPNDWNLKQRWYNYTWRVTESGALDCLNCEKETETEDYIESSENTNQGLNLTTSENNKIIIDQNGIDIDVKENGDSVRIKIGKDGVKIKTN